MSLYGVQMLLTLFANTMVLGWFAEDEGPKEEEEIAGVRSIISFRVPT